MKTLKSLVLAACVLSLAAPLLAADTNVTAKAEKDKKPYPLTTCVVSGDKLGEMGDAYIYKYKGREIHFCCKGCVKDFNKDPQKYLKKLDEAEKAAKEKADKATGTDKK
jgi:YHS domain-containing protein